MTQGKPLTFDRRWKRRFGVVAQLPTKWVVVLSLIDGAITVLNQTTFGLPTIWKTTLTVLLGVFSFLGIGPLMGPKFQAALHIPKAVGTVIGVVLIVLLVVVQQDAAMPYRAIIVGVVNVAGGLGFAPAYVPTL